VLIDKSNKQTPFYKKIPKFTEFLLALFHEFIGLFPLSD